MTPEQTSKQTSIQRPEQTSDQTQKKTYEHDLRGKLAASLCGHDKGKVYVILESNEERVLLANGVNRTIAAPKEKNRRHIQPVLRIPADVEEALRELTDLSIKRALKLYCRRSEEKEAGTGPVCAENKRRVE